MGQMATAVHRPRIDVLAFPPHLDELRHLQRLDAGRWRELERRARVALFFGTGMFLAWAADVGAAFEIGHAGGSTLFGMASVPLALVVILAHVYGRWALEYANRGLSHVHQQYADVTQRQAMPLQQLAREHMVIAQYLRCVGRQPRALLKLERIALHAWADAHQAKGL